MAPGGAPMKSGNGVIFGQVTEADSNRPVPGAIVTINLPGSQALRVMADSQGRFGFRDMPAGGFNMTSTRPGWVDGAYGRTRPNGPPMALVIAEGERVSGVVVPMWRYATIAGSVTDEAGDALVNMPVRVLKRTLTGGKVTLKEYQSDSTDDRGNYRVGQLEPGEYVVVVPYQAPSNEMPFAAAEASAVRDVLVRAVAPAGGGGNAGFFFNGSGDSPSAGVGEDGRPLAFGTMFYPNSPVSTRATVITVTSGEERASVDFQIRALPTSKVSGTATGPEGAVANLQISLVPAEADVNATSIETISGFSDGQGKFTIEGVPAGNYILRATRMPRMTMAGQVMFRAVTSNGGAMTVMTQPMAPTPPTPPTNDVTLWAEMNVGVGNKDLEGVAVSLRTGVKMSGTVQFTGSAQKPDPAMMSSMAVILEPADPKPGVTQAMGRVDQNGQFSTVGVPPGRYFVRMKAAMPGWTFQSAMAGGRDASVVAVDFESNDLTGVTLNFTDQPSELSGQVQGDGVLEGTAVIVFPADSTAWTGYGTTSRRLLQTRADKQGNFKLQALPAGDYLAVAMPDKMANDWSNPKALEAFAAAATRVHVSDNQKANVSLRVIK